MSDFFKTGSNNVKGWLGIHDRGLVSEYGNVQTGSNPDYTGNILLILADIPLILTEMPYISAEIPLKLAYIPIIPTKIPLKLS